jgi:hypothetical protein
MKNKLMKIGYVAEETLAKKVAAFEKAANSKTCVIPCMMLTGKPGAGKTFLAESFANLDSERSFLFHQMKDGKNLSEELLGEPNIKAILTNDAENSFSEGILLQAIRKSHEGPVVLCLDEWDKSSASADAFLLDFLNSGRITDGKTVYTAKAGNIWVFLTSNDEREISDALRRRVRKVEVKKMSTEAFLTLLGLSTDHVLGRVYEYAPAFTYAQAVAYLEDVNYSEELDVEMLSQYVDIDSEMISKTKISEEILGEIDEEGITNSIDWNKLMLEIEKEYIDEISDLVSESRYCDFSISGENDESTFFLNVYTFDAFKKVLETGIDFDYESCNTIKLFFDKKYLEKVLVNCKTTLAKINKKTIIGWSEFGGFMAEITIDILKELL